MKTRSFLLSMLFAVTALAFISGCSGKSENGATEAPEDQKTEERRSPAAGAMQSREPQFQVDDKFQEQLTSVFTSYVGLKDAFVDTDPNKVQGEASEMKEAIAQVDMKLLSGAAHNDWMDYLAAIRTSLNEIQASDDIEIQREAFSTLSDNLYKSIKAFGLNGKEAFYGYCPMAFDNEGGYWLSDQTTIRNPYFGDKMLTCGEVKEKLM